MTTHRQVREDASGRCDDCDNGLSLDIRRGPHFGTTYCPHCQPGIERANLDLPALEALTAFDRIASHEALLRENESRQGGNATAWAKLREERDELLAALTAVLNDAYKGDAPEFGGGGLCAPSWDTVTPARKLIAKARGES